MSQDFHLLPACSRACDVDIQVICGLCVVCVTHRRFLWEASGEWRTSWQCTSGRQLRVFDSRQYRQSLFILILCHSFTIHGQFTRLHSYYMVIHCGSLKKTWQSITVHQIFIDFDIIALPLPEHVMRVESQLCIAHLLNYFLTSSCQWRHQSVIFVTMFITVSVFHFYQVVFAHI